MGQKGEAPESWEPCRVSIRIRLVKSGGPDRRYLLAAVLSAVFVSLYPALDLAGYCDDGGCPDVTQVSASSSLDLPHTGVLTSAVAAAAAVSLVTTTLPLSERRPDELRLCPESPPPRT